MGSTSQTSESTLLLERSRKFTCIKTSNNESYGDGTSEKLHQLEDTINKILEPYYQNGTHFLAMLLSVVNFH